MRVFVRLPSREVVEVEASLDECVADIVGRPLALWRSCQRFQRQRQEFSDGETDLDSSGVIISNDCADLIELTSTSPSVSSSATCTAWYGGLLLPPERTLRQCGAQSDCVLEASVGSDGGLKGGMQGSFAMQIAYKRDKESKRRLAENSPFVSCISQVTAIVELLTNRKETEKKRRKPFFDVYCLTPRSLHCFHIMLLSFLLSRICFDEHGCYCSLHSHHFHSHHFSFPHRHLCEYFHPLTLLASPHGKAEERKAGRRAGGPCLALQACASGPQPSCRPRRLLAQRRAQVPAICLELARQGALLS